MIRVENLCCGYGSKRILSNINVNISKGELTCILGKNGTGKTTLFKTILGLLPPLSGEISYQESSLSALSPLQMAKLMSYVPQAHGSPFPFSVLDVVLMGQFVHSTNLFGKPKKENIDRAKACIETLGIEKLTHKNFSKISGGEKQMVLIARAMAQAPAFIAMDEPTANLDMGNSIRVMNVARLLTEKGYGVIMNTHMPEQALQHAHQAIMLGNGGLIDAGNPSHVLQSDALSELYNTPIELVEATSSTGQKHQLLINL